MCVSVLPACTSLGLEVGATDSCKLPCGCWELNLAPLEEQPVLLTTKPSLQAKHINLLLYSSAFVCLHVCTSHMLASHGSEKRVLNHLELDRVNHPR